MIRHLSLKAYGKINLGLDVIRKREDGYHDVRMIMQTVRIFDHIDIDLRREPGITLTTNLFYLPANENNLVYQAARLLMDEFGITHGVNIRLKKTIPVAAGMAGGSSDAAAVLFGINKMFRLGLSQQDLMERGVKLGADVPYCILRGTALSEGIGEILTPLPPPPGCKVLIVKPGISVSTKTVYENLRVNELKPDQHPDIDGILRAIHEQDLAGMCQKMGNILEAVTLQRYPVIRNIRNFMMEQGADGAIMSGSGPTVFGLYSDPAAARKAYEQFRYRKSPELAKQVFLTDFFNNKQNNYTEGENQ